MIDPFATEVHGRQRQEQLLAEAAHAGLLRQARLATVPRALNRRPPTAAFGARLGLTMRRAPRAAACAAGLVLVAAGTRLQRLALDTVGPQAADLECASC